MNTGDFFRSLREKITGLNAISLRSGILQMRLDALLAIVEKLNQGGFSLRAT